MLKPSIIIIRMTLHLLQICTKVPSNLDHVFDLFPPQPLFHEQRLSPRSGNCVSDLSTVHLHNGQFIEVVVQIIYIHSHITVVKLLNEVLPDLPPS